MRFGIIGLNKEALEFINLSTINDSIKVTSLCSRDYDFSMQVASKFEIKNIYHDFIKMIESGNIDAVYLCTPTDFHYNIIINCLNRQIPVLCPSPLAGSLKEVISIIDCANTNKCYLQDNTLLHYGENYLTIKQKLEDIGPIRKVILNNCQKTQEYLDYQIGDIDPKLDLKHNGGSTLNQGIYPISLALSLFGKPKDVLANCHKLNKEVDIEGTVVLDYEDFQCIINHSMWADSIIGSEIQGENGTILIEDCKSLADIYLHDENTPLIKIGNSENNHLNNSVEYFCNMVSSGARQADTFSFHDILLTYTIISKCRLLTKVTYDSDY